MNVTAQTCQCSALDRAVLDLSILHGITVQAERARLGLTTAPVAGEHAPTAPTHTPTRHDVLEGPSR